MDKETMKGMLGMNTQSGVARYKLNEVQMSGDTGEFKLRDILTEKPKGEKAPTEDLGKTIDGVILKMRWKLSRYDEPNATYYSSTEYDDKWKDEVTVYPARDKGSVETMKAKHSLSTQRVIYFYVPKKQQIVRLIVKASALSGGDKNPNGELGLFEYIDEYAQSELLPCQSITTCVGVFRAGKNQDGSPNKRKDHYAMTFSKGRDLTDTEFIKIQTMMVEVNEKTNMPKFEAEEIATEAAPAEDNWDMALAPNEEPQGSNPDEIPF